MKKIILSIFVALNLFTLSAPLKAEINTKSSGIVLISAYINVLMERLDIVKDGRFVSADAQYKCAVALHYLATGSDSHPSDDGAVLKVLCGLPLNARVDFTAPISEKEKQLMSSLIEALISYWPAIGNSSVAGFRGNWLDRSGLLMESQDKWSLTVEHRAYDVLINRSPFSFSVIKLPWMAKPLYVNWPY